VQRIMGCDRLDCGFCTGVIRRQKASVLARHFSPFGEKSAAIAGAYG